MAHSDSELIKQTLDGDETAFGFLVDKYKGAVHALAYRKIGDFHTAEEITQDTFLQAHQKLSTLKDWRHFPGWLYTIASRFCLMWHRKNRLPMQSIDAVERGHVDALAQAKYANEQTRQTVHSALEELPESQRTVLTLHYLGGMTCIEIARFMGTSRGAILDRLYRARLQLKKELIPMMRQTLGAFQLPPAFTTRMMNRIDQFRPTATPVSKPLMPWVAAVATLVVAIFIGLGQQSMTRSQRPYSLDVPDSTVRVELIDAPAFFRPVTNPTTANQSGQLNPRNEKHGTQRNSVALGTVSAAAKDDGPNDSDWEQTNGPSGGDVTQLFQASDGTLYAATFGAGIFRSDTDGDTWVALKHGLEVYTDQIGGKLPFVHAITESNGVIYLKDYESFFYSDNRGESWHWVKFPDQIETSEAFAVSGGRIYVGQEKEGVIYSDDYGKSWTSFRNGFPIDLPDNLMASGSTAIAKSQSNEPPDELIAVGTTLFAKRGDNLYRLKAGEESWAQISSLKNLRFFTVVQGALIIGNQTDLRRSTDGGDNWAPLAGNIRLWSWENKDVNVDIPWSRVPIELEFRSMSILGIAGFADTNYILLSDGSLLRSTENGTWVTTETGLTGVEPWERIRMVALPEHAVCVATGEGVYQWRDGEKSWRQINKGLVSTNVPDIVSYKNALYATTGHDIVKSVDGGHRWTPVHQGLPVTIAWAFAVADGELYLGLHETNYGRRDRPFTAGIYRLADDQNSWIPVQTEMRTDNLDHPKKDLYQQFERLQSVDELVISGNTFYAIAQNGSGYGCYKWRKGDQFWTRISPEIEPHFNYIWTNLVVSGKTIYLNASRNLMYSNNRGKSWSIVDTYPGYDDPNNGQIEGPIMMGNTVYIAVYERGVFRSSDRGKTWDLVNDGLPQEHSWELYAVGNSLFAVGQEAGIFQLNHDQTWAFVKPYPPNFMITMEVVDTTLYAATGGQGVYRIDLTKSGSD